MKKNNPEYHIQCEFVKSMAFSHPELMIFSDTAAHIGKTMLQQIRANKLQSENSKVWPDVFIAQPSGVYAGLFLEFKAKTPYLKNGKTLSRDKHIQAQESTMERLRQRGYAARFVWTVEQAVQVVLRYLENLPY